MATQITGSDSYYPDIVTDPANLNHSNGTYGNTYNYGSISIRLQLATMCAQGLKSPTHYYDQKETDDAYQEWALKAFKMADALIDEYNRKIK